MTRPRKTHFLSYNPIRQGRADLWPRVCVNEKNPQSVELTGGSATVVAGGGFEPPTSGL